MSRERSEPSLSVRACAGAAKIWNAGLRHEPILARRAGILTRGKNGRSENQQGFTVGSVSRSPQQRPLVGSFGKANSSDTRRATGIAVLPFENLGGNKNDAVLIDAACRMTS